MTPPAPNRNAPCPCGSGKKFKNCCRNKAEGRGFLQTLTGFFQARRDRPWMTAVVFLLLAAAGTAVYANSFSGVFVFDDNTQILQKQSVHSLAWPWDFMKNARRPVLYLTLALNYALCHDRPWGYHAFNLSVHVLAAFVLFLVLRLTLTLPALRPQFGGSALGLSVLTALLWLVHPLQTQSVTYVVQRAESFMGLTFLLALYCSARYMVTRRRVWMLAAGLACLVSGLTKEVAAAAPAVILLYDRTFVSSSWKAVCSKHRGLYGILAMTWVVMGILLWTTRPEKNPTAGFAYKGVDAWRYALTQPEIIFHYLRLVFWPHPQILDYDWPPVKGWTSALPALAGIGVLTAASLAAFRKHAGLGFLGLAFLMILAPSSSFIPLKDLAFEHRMYLPLACVLVLTVLACRWVFRHLFSGRPAAVALALVLSAAVISVEGFWSFQRNRVYQSPFTFWADVITKRPENARAINNYGAELLKAGKAEEASGFFRRALQIDPDYSDAHVNLGTILAQKGRHQEAITHFEKAIDLEPDYAIAFNNLGASLNSLERFSDAIPYFHKALDLDFKEAGVYLNLGIAYAQTGRPHQAIGYLEESLKLDPTQPQAKAHLKEIRQKMSVRSK